MNTIRVSYDHGANTLLEAILINGVRLFKTGLSSHPIPDASYELLGMADNNLSIEQMCKLIYFSETFSSPEELAMITIGCGTLLFKHSPVFATMCINRVGEDAVDYDFVSQTAEEFHKSALSGSNEPHAEIISLFVAGGLACVDPKVAAQHLQVRIKQHPELFGAIIAKLIRKAQKGLSDRFVPYSNIDDDVHDQCACEKESKLKNFGLQVN